MQVDLYTGAIAGRISFPPGHHSGEALFVPRAGAGSEASVAACRGTVVGDEDDGFLICFVTHSDGGLFPSEARSLSLEASEV